MPSKTTPTTTRVSWLRIGLMVSGFIALVPLTFIFGLFGFLGGLAFIVLAALAS
jgi:hypothetical protein